MNRAAWTHTAASTTDDASAWAPSIDLCNTTRRALQDLALVYGNQLAHALGRSDDATRTQLLYAHALRDIPVACIEAAVRSWTGDEANRFPPRPGEFAAVARRLHQEREAAHDRPIAAVVSDVHMASHWQARAQQLDAASRTIAEACAGDHTLMAMTVQLMLTNAATASDAERIRRGELPDLAQLQHSVAMARKRLSDQEDQ